MKTREDILSLTPCPFCGGAAERVDIEDGDNAGGSFVHCTVCDASGNVEFEFKENFISNWNRRAAPTPPAAEAPGQEPVAVKEAVDDLIERLLDAQQDINLAANQHMDQSLCDASALIDEVEKVLRSISAPPSYADAEAKGLEKAAHVALDENYAAIAAGQAAKTEGQKYRAMGRSEAAIRIGDRIRSLASPAPKGGE